MDKEILKEIFGSVVLFAGLYVMTVLAFCLQVRVCLLYCSCSYAWCVCMKFFMEVKCSRSSAGQSTGFLNLGSQVRILSGAQLKKGIIMKNVSLSQWLLAASMASVAGSIAVWSLTGESDPAHAERFGIFVGLWAPTLMGLSNYFKK